MEKKHLLHITVSAYEIREGGGPSSKQTVNFHSIYDKPEDLAFQYGIIKKFLGGISNESRN